MLVQPLLISNKRGQNCQQNLLTSIQKNRYMLKILSHISRLLVLDSHNLTEELMIFVYFNTFSHSVRKYWIIISHDVCDGEMYKFMPRLHPEQLTTLPRARSQMGRETSLHHSPSFSKRGTSHSAVLNRRWIAGIVFQQADGTAPSAQS